jgi:hypothetical protein
MLEALQSSRHVRIIYELIRWQMTPSQVKQFDSASHQYADIRLCTICVYWWLKGIFRNFRILNFVISLLQLKRVYGSGQSESCDTTWHARSTICMVLEYHIWYVPQRYVPIGTNGTYNVMSQLSDWKRAHMCTENHVCFGRVHGSQLREGANAGQHTPTLSLPPSHHCLHGEVYRTCVRTYSSTLHARRHCGAAVGLAVEAVV